MRAAARERRAKPSNAGSVSARVISPRAVGAEIHEHDDVAVAHAIAGLPSASRIAVGLHELVGFAARVGRGQRLERGSGGVGRAAVDDQLVRLRHALPALVAVHRVVAADDRRDRVAPGMPRADRLA